MCRTFLICFIHIYICIVVIDAQICMQYCISQVFSFGISFVYRVCDKVLKVAAFSPSALVPFFLRHPLHGTFQLMGPVIPTVVPLYCCHCEAVAKVLTDMVVGETKCY